MCVSMCVCWQEVLQQLIVMKLPNIITLGKEPESGTLTVSTLCETLCCQHHTCIKSNCWDSRTQIVYKKYLKLDSPFRMWFRNKWCILGHYDSSSLQTIVVLRPPSMCVESTYKSIIMHCLQCSSQHWHNIEVCVCVCGTLQTGRGWSWRKCCCCCWAAPSSVSTRRHS